MDSNSAKISNKPFFENLTGLRFIGALAVFVFHCFTLHREIWGEFSNSSAFHWIGKIAGKGHLGINLFFTLSGFLITYLLLHERRKTGSVNIKHFIMRRTIRIWPLYFLIVIFGFFIYPHLPFGKVTIHEFWRYAIFLSNIDEVILGAQDSINFLSATWTVSVEEQFYIFFALILLLFQLIKRYYLLLFFSLIILSSLIFRFYNLGDERTLYFHTFSVMSDLAFGGILGLLAFKNKLVGWIRGLRSSQLFLIYIIGIGLIFTDSLYLLGTLSIFERLIPSIFFSFMILEQVYSDQSLFKVDRIKGFFHAGEISYGFYMFHCIVLYYMSVLFSEMGWVYNISGFILFVITSLVVTYVLAHYSYAYFERPFLKLKKFFQ